MERLSRREVLALIETIAAAMALPACKKRGESRPPAPEPPPPPTPTPAKALDAAAFRALDAATARILPASADFAGARDARVMGFIEKQLVIEPFRRLAPGMVALARALDQQAVGRGKPAFAELDVAAQDQLLDELSRGAWPGDRSLPQRELFVLLHTLTLEGFLADPNHGGNHGGVGWKAIDFAEPALRTPGAPGAAGGHGHGH